ncbi:MAG: hypothetical protein IJ566_05315 [Cardiobacteriaceae bacterium]|nr:hypothetical protein [Cardiobacteriaceae bacterium]
MARRKNTSVSKTTKELNSNLNLNNKLNQLEAKKEAQKQAVKTKQEHADKLAENLQLTTEMNKSALASSKKKRSFFWLLLTSPFMAIVWFILYLLDPVYNDYLSSAQQYLPNYKLLFFCLLIILGLVWIANSLTVVNKNTNKKPPLMAWLGITAFFSLLSSGIELAGDYFSFYTGFLWTGLGTLFISTLVLIILYRAFLIHYLDTKKINILALTISLPCIVLMSYQYLQVHKFFSERVGRVPSYNRILMPAENTQKKSIKDFLEIKK